MRRLWIVLGLLVVLLVAAAIGLNLWVKAYLRSDAFRQLVSAKTGEALRARAEFQPLSWSGSSVFSPALDAEGEPGGTLEKLSAQQVRANVDWRAIFDGAWRVTRIEVVRLDAALRTEVEREASEHEPGPTPEAPPPKKGFLPNRFELGEIDVQEADFAVGGFGKIRNSALVMRPDGSGWVFDGRGGKLLLTGHPSLDIANFRLRLQHGGLYVTDASLRLGETGVLELSGEIGTAGKDYDLRVEWSDVDAAEVLDETWRKRLSGTLAGHAKSIQPKGGVATTTGDFLLSDGRLEGLPVQVQIADFTRTPQFRHMPVHEISGKFTQREGGVEIRDFVMESRGLLRIEGGCTVGPNGELAGDFQVGVTPQTLQWLPGSRERVFVVSRNGYLWTTLRVGGTVDRPTEDLSGRLARAMGDEIIETGTNLIKQAPDKADEVLERALEVLSPLIP